MSDYAFHYFEKIKLYYTEEWRIEGGFLYAKATYIEDAPAESWMLIPQTPYQAMKFYYTNVKNWTKDFELKINEDDYLYKIVNADKETKGRLLDLTTGDKKGFCLNLFQQEVILDYFLS